MTHHMKVRRADWDRVLDGELTAGELAKLLGIDRGTVYRQVKRAGWPLPHRETLTAVPTSPTPAEPGRGLDPALIATNESQSHQQVLRIVHKLQAHLEQSIDEAIEGGRVFKAGEAKVYADAAVSLQGVRTATEKRMKALGGGTKHVGYSLIEEILQAPNRPNPHDGCGEGADGAGDRATPPH